MDFNRDEIVEDYCKNNFQQIWKICRAIISTKPVLWNFEEIELFEVCTITFSESLNTYDNSKCDSFGNYLYGNILRAFYDYVRDYARFKRCNLQTDKYGNIMKGEDGKTPIIIQDISLDEKIEDNLEWSEKIESDFNLDNEISEEFGLHTDNEEEWHQEVKDYLSSLSPLQKQIIHLLSIKFTPEEICEELHITKKHYNNSFNRMTASDKIKPMEDMIERMNRSCSC